MNNFCFAMVLLFSQTISNTFNNSVVFPCFFAAPVYENEQQTAIESYDGGEFAHKFYNLCSFLGDNFLVSLKATIFRPEIYGFPLPYLVFYLQRMAATTTITTMGKVTE
jgi:hypothetical protein